MRARRGGCSIDRSFFFGGPKEKKNARESSALLVTRPARVCFEENPKVRERSECNRGRVSRAFGVSDVPRDAVRTAGGSAESCTAVTSMTSVSLSSRCFAP